MQIGPGLIASREDQRSHFKTFLTTSLSQEDEESGRRRRRRRGLNNIRHPLIDPVRTSCNSCHINVMSCNMQMSMSPSRDNDMIQNDSHKQPDVLHKSSLLTDAP